MNMHGTENGRNHDTCVRDGGLTSSALYSVLRTLYPQTFSFLLQLFLSILEIKCVRLKIYIETKLKEDTFG